LRFVFFSFIPASLTITCAVTAMATVTEHVHRDKGDEDQHPEPVCRKPCHDFPPSGFVVASSSMLEDGNGDETLLRRVLIAATAF
jgi:hypothetical protein